MVRWEDLRKSKEFYEEARKYLPGGVSYALRYFTPHPIYVAKAKGSRVWDVDGNEYVDYWIAHGAVVTGFGYEPILEAVREQLAPGTVCMLFSFDFSGCLGYLCGFRELT
ncbi:MAG: aminotransferase class III-fold pyridoxal phosphate-dependent enzyme [Zestosphaera sp.]